ncbi:MAG: Flp pilus assembly complex ATPase component TadA, partial [Gemmatimonadaceae bacterium]|nr:Flp pilus assembly complex ATPase component TadA [Gemmatimonadaceae bacterium]
MAATAASSERLGDLLVREGLITREQLDKALQEQKQNGTRVGYNLVKLGFIAETELTKMLARQFKMPAVDLSRFEVDPKIAKLIPADLAIRHLVLPLKRDGRTLTVAMADPTNLGVLEDLKFITRYDIFPVIGGEFTLKGTIERLYENVAETQVADLLSVIDDMTEGEVEVVEEKEEDVSAAALSAAMEDAPVVKLINAILSDAVRRGASDIHFECFEHDIRVRYRVDGALHEVMKPPMKLKAALISRFKIMAQLNIAERRVPQDGRIKLKMGKKVIDYRVSTLPTLFGEKIVLRILDKGNLTLDLEKFGIEPKAEKDLMEAVSNPYGMVLVTGPTGSGKTTTLYSALSKVNNIDVNIMTAEDPVEYNLYGVNQVLVRTEIGMTFAAALKAFLRQDPNIIMVGEIRDLETGGIAIKAALTGHMVLSTLHTNSAPETVTRLMDMGLEPFNVASALNLVLAQRLLRRICGSCKTQYTPDAIELDAAKVKPTTTLRELRFTQETIENAKTRATKEAIPLLANITLDSPISQLPFFKGKGCDACGGSGMKGRQGVYEVMPMSPNLRKLILMSVGAAEIRDAAVDEGMLT